MGIEELHEMEEHAEHSAHDPSLLPVTFTMAVLAVVLAATPCSGTAPTRKNCYFKARQQTSGHIIRRRISASIPMRSSWISSPSPPSRIPHKRKE